MYVHVCLCMFIPAVGIRCADHVTPLYPQKLTLASLTDGGRSVGQGPVGV